MRFRDQNLKKAFTLSYDDGVTQDLRLVELMNEYGLKGTFNLNFGRCGFRGIYRRGEQRVTEYVLSAEDMREIYAGHEIAGHTLTHKVLIDLAEDEVVRQVEEDRLRLSELAGYEVRGFAYPGAKGVTDPGNERLADILRRRTGVKYARVIRRTESFAPPEDLFLLRPTYYHMANYERLMELGREFVELKTDTPQVFYLWGHSYELDIRPDGWGRLEEFFRLISGRDGIFYGTNAEVLL